MDSIETEIVEDDYDGLATREARRKHAKDRYTASKEATEFRALAQEALLKKEKGEAERKENAKKLDQVTEKDQRELFIEAELENIAQAIPAEELKAYVLDFVQVFVEITRHASLLIKLQFPDNYPQGGLVLDLRSKYLDSELVEKLKMVGETEAKKHLGQAQVLPVVDRLRSILSTNRLAPAFADLRELKEFVAKQRGCELKSAKEKTGSVSVRLVSKEYFLELDVVVPMSYPAKAVEIRKHVSNLPLETVSLFITSAKDDARRRAELPEMVQTLEVGREGAGSGSQCKSERLSQSQTLATRNRVNALSHQSEETKEKALAKRRELEATFVSRPSLFPLIQYLHEQCLTPLASGTCRICNKQLLPSDPALVGRIPKNMTTLRLYCVHMYHFKCLETYVSTPPFGKKCLHCDTKIEHNRLMTNEKILEQRWTHQQARKREIEDVADFMSL